MFWFYIQLWKIPHCKKNWANYNHKCTVHRYSCKSGKGKAIHDSLPNIVRVVKSRRMRWAGHVARMGQERGVYRVLVGKPEGKRPMGRPRRRWEDNIKMDLQEVEGCCGDWMELAQDRDRWRALVSKVMNLRVPKMRGISWLVAESVGFSRRTLLRGVSK